MKDITVDLGDRISLLHLRYVAAFGEEATSGFFATPKQMAEALESGLRAGDTEAVEATRAVVDPGELTSSEFWATPLGRLLFTAGGYGAETCSQSVAAGVLGCSRQWVSAMLAEKKLDVAPGRAVYVGQVLGVLKNRADRLAAELTR